MKYDLQTFAGQAMPVFKQQAAQAIITQSLRDAAKVKEAMVELLGDFMQQQAKDSTAATIEVAKAGQKIMIKPEVFAEYINSFATQITETMKIQQEGIKHRAEAEASYKESLEKIELVLSGKATADKNGNIIPVDGNVTRLAGRQANSGKSNFLS